MSYKKIVVAKLINILKKLGGGDNIIYNITGNI